jgi:type I restriction enzyme, S subunit
MINNKNNIPKDWVIKELNEVVAFLDGKRKPIKDSDRNKMQGAYPYYGASGIIDYVNDYIFDEDLILLGEDGANIINRSSPLAFRVSGKIWVNNHAHVLKPKNGYDIGYITEFLESIKYDKYNTGTAQPKLNKEICSGIPILLPPLPEQKAIAQVLSTADAAIHTTEKLIAQKELRKKWLMQQLLTGKKRLKGFDREWKEASISDFGIVQTGNTPSKLDSENWGGNYNWCTADDMKSKYVSNTLQKLSDKGWKTARVAKANSVLVTCIASIGVNAITKADTGFNQQINSITPSEHHNVEFIYYLIVLSKNKLMEYAGAGALPMLNKNTFMSIKFKIPSLEEQTAIAQVLQAADKEITLLKAKAEKLREQKKGLMQQLLTGKIRIK